MYKNIKKDDAVLLKEKIKKGTAIYYYRATPFTEHGEFNYNGVLSEDFFFENMFSEVGKCSEYINRVTDSLERREHKSILLIGNQGCGKTTFMHYLTREYKNANFVFLDFDKDTSNPELSEYIEKFSTHLLNLLKNDEKTNKYFYDLFIQNKELITEKINANNNIIEFFDDFRDTFILKHNLKKEERFIKTINSLFFNQILSLTIIWYMCKYKKDNRIFEIKPTIFCLDNLDVLVNKEIIERFFKEYFLFVRNVDSIIQHINDDFFKNNGINYNELFCFIFCCRKHTWARVREYYTHKNSFVHVSTKELDITDAFDKKHILSKREEYIIKNSDYYGEFKQKVCQLKALLSDLDSQEGRSHNIYDLFDDDYRQCNITIGDILREAPGIIDNYFLVKNNSMGMSLYGSRGVFYKALFEKFKTEGIFSSIGVIEVDSEDPLVSNARLILNYLNYKTYSYTHQTKQKTVPFEKLVADFEGIISKDDIDHSLIAMFKLGDDSCWNQLIAFTEIHTEKVDTCEGLDIFITKAGHEYLNLIATHFEFFNTRVLKSRRIEAPLFDKIQIQKNENVDFTYNFEETICNVKEIVKNCCEKMTRYYNTYMGERFNDKYKYLHSYYVYGDAKVLHGERIIHTHIRYIDQYRLYILKTISELEEKKIINQKLVELIENYIKIGEDNPTVLTDISTVTLFPGFKRKIKVIRDSEYKDCTTRIDV